MERSAEETKDTEEKDDTGDPGFKSPAVAGVLGFLLGPAGLIYVSAGTGCGLALLEIVVSLAFLPSSYSMYSYGYSSYGRSSAGAGVITLVFHIGCAIAGPILARDHNARLRSSIARREKTAGLKALRTYQKNYPVSGGRASVTIPAAGESGAGTPVLETDGGMGVSVFLSPLGCRILAVRSPDRNGDDGPAAPDIRSEEENGEGSLCGAILDMTAGNGRFSPETQHLARQLWEYEIDAGAVVMRHARQKKSALNITVRFSMAGTRLTIDYEAETAVPRTVLLTHAFAFSSLFDGIPEGDVCDNTLYLPAAEYASASDPALKAVDGSAFDFRTRRQITLEDIGDDGLNHFFIFPPADGPFHSAAAVRSLGRAGRAVIVKSTDSALWLASGRSLQKALSLSGYSPALLLCPIQPLNAPLTALQPGQRYKKTTEYDFGITSWQPYVSPAVSGEEPLPYGFPNRYNRFGKPGAE